MNDQITKPITSTITVGEAILNADGQPITPITITIPFWTSQKLPRHDIRTIAAKQLGEELITAIERKLTEPFTTENTT